MVLYLTDVCKIKNMAKITPRKKPGAICCVVGCRNNSLNTQDTHFYVFPKLAHKKQQRDKWINALKRKNPDGSPWQPSKQTRICSQHFIGNQKSEHPFSPSFIPTMFPNGSPKEGIIVKGAVDRFNQNLKQQTASSSMKTVNDRKISGEEAAQMQAKCNIDLIQTNITDEIKERRKNDNISKDLKMETEQEVIIIKIEPISEELKSKIKKEPGEVMNLSLNEEHNVKCDISKI